MAFLLDLIIVCILILSIIITAKRGFVKSIALIASFFIAIFISITLSGPIANFTYDKIIEPGVVKSIESTINKNIDNNEQAMSEQVWQALPKFVKNSDKINKSNISVDLSQEDTVHSVAVSTSREVVRPIAVSFVKIITSLILFIAFSFVCKFLIKLLSGIFSFSIVGKVNKILGGALGVVNGIIYSVLFVLIAKFIISLSGGFLFFTNQAVNNSLIFRFILEILPGIF